MQKQLTQDDVVYFIVTDRFYGRGKRTPARSDNAIHGGTLDGILDKLSYLSELGVTALWITPVYENIARAGASEPYHYYWPRCFERIDARLLDGTHLPQTTEMSTLAAFIERCEARGFKVVLDMVVNHAGYGAESEFDPTWFNRGGSGEIKGELAGLPDFNHDQPEVVDYFIDNIERWLTRGGVTNIRMDTVKHVEPRFWHFFKSQIRGQYPATRLLGEVLCEGKDDVSKLMEYQNYHDFDSLFDFPLCTALRATLIYDGSLRGWLARPRLHPDEPRGVLDDDNPFQGGYRNPNELVTLLENHDLEQRIMSHARAKHPGSEQGLQWATRVLKLCLGALFTMRGIPQLYYGGELGMEGWKDGDDRDLRRDFPWEVIGTDQRPRPELRKEREVHDWTRALIRLRKQNPALRYGATLTLWCDDLVYAYLRVSTHDVALMIIHNGYQPMPSSIRIDLPPSVLPASVVQGMSALRHWRTSEPLAIENGQVLARLPAKTIEIYCSSPVGAAG